jgi:hypothetical protein
MRSLLHTAARYDRATLRVPVVLPLVEVSIGKDGSVSVLLNREPYSVDGALTRDDLRRLLDDIAADLRTPVRVEVHEADDSTFTDIITPPHATPAPAPSPSIPSPRTVLASPFGIAGDGFAAGEEVSVCVVVARQVADADGITQLRLPPALLAEHPIVVLIGRISGTVARSEGAA